MTRVLVWLAVYCLVVGIPSWLVMQWPRLGTAVGVPAGLLLWWVLKQQQEPR